MTVRPDIAAALVEATRTINAAPDLDSTLQAIVDTAARSVPGMTHVGISIVHRGGAIETQAATDSLVQALDALQYELNDGPCLQAIRQDPVVRVVDARHEKRWPGFIAKAVEMGLRSQLGLRLYFDDRTLGGLNLYSTTHDDIDDEVEHLAELFAAHAAIAVGRAMTESELNTALASRKTIGQALGVLMERYDLDEDRAFAYLIRVSSHSGVRLREIASEIVRDGNERATKVTGA